MPAPVFLIGGGRDPEGVAASHRPFAEACDGQVLCLVLDDEPDVDRWVAGLASVGLEDVRPLLVSAGRPPAVGDLEGAGGVYVAGGWTPAYQEVVCGGDFGAALGDVPYAGFSAGAAIAASSALVGGWKLDGVVVGDEDAGEDLEELEVRPGLGLVPFAVDAHASQWGTLTRLAHAVSGGLVAAGVAVDEHTCVEVRGGELTVHGWGSAYRVGLGTLHVMRAS
jgi:cyanophycinase